MKYLLVFVWFLIIILSEYINDFIALYQLETAFVVGSLWYFNKVLSKKSFNAVIITFICYYVWIFTTDQFIEYMFYELIIVESLLFSSILMCHLSED